MSFVRKAQSRAKLNAQAAFIHKAVPAINRGLLCYRLIFIFVYIGYQLREVCVSPRNAVLIGHGQLIIFYLYPTLYGIYREAVILLGVRILRKEEQVSIALGKLYRFVGAHRLGLEGAGIRHVFAG